MTLSFFSKAQLPDNYTHVDQIVWVVDDIEQVIEKWELLGFNQIISLGLLELPNQKVKGKPIDIKLKMALAKLDKAKVIWIEPISNGNVFSAFKSKHQQGALSLMHRFQDSASFIAEVERLKNLGIPVIQQGTVSLPGGEFEYALMDTYMEGKYTLGLVYGADLHQDLINQSPFDATFTQYAFAVSQAEKVSDFWEKVGFPTIEITHPEVREKRYFGKYHDFAMDLGWQRHGDIVYEWCIPLKPPTVYEDHIEKYGEGIQHLGFQVADIDQAIAQWSSRGFAVSQSGAWGEKDQPGSGRFAYINTDRYGGVAIELLWNFKSD